MNVRIEVARCRNISLYSIIISYVTHGIYWRNFHYSFLFRCSDSDSSSSASSNSKSQSGSGSRSESPSEKNSPEKVSSPDGKTDSESTKTPKKERLADIKQVKKNSTAKLEVGHHERVYDPMNLKLVIFFQCFFASTAFFYSTFLWALGV